MDNINKFEFVGQLPENSIIYADCLEAMKYIVDESIDMVMCDLPYC